MSAAPIAPVEALVPHRAPMLLVDRVDDYGDGTVRCAATVKADSPFTHGGRQRAVVALEYMAQGVAAYVGLRALERGEPVVTGFLVGARTLTLETAWLDVGDELVIEARHTWGDVTAGSFDCVVRRGGHTLAEASLSVYRGDLSELGSLR